MRTNSEECPSDDFKEGKPSGECWGDGHYMCEQCKHFRVDFTGESGIQKRHELYQIQGTPGYSIKIATLK